MEAALRTAYHHITGENLKDVNIMATRGLEGVKEGVIDINGIEIRIAVAHGLSNVKHVVQKTKEAIANNEELPWHFIEVMACPGGCVGGGGQPYGVTDEIRLQRAAGLYQDDTEQTIRCSHDNPMIKKIYSDFLGEPLSHKAHELLHTSYKARPIYLK